MLCPDCRKIPFLCICKRGTSASTPSGRTPVVPSRPPASSSKEPSRLKRTREEMKGPPRDEEEEDEPKPRFVFGSLPPPTLGRSSASVDADEVAPLGKKSRGLPTPPPLPPLPPKCTFCGSAGLEVVRPCACEQHRMCESCLGEADGPWHATQCETCGNLCTTLCGLHSRDISCPGCQLLVRGLAHNTRPLPMNDGTGRVGFPMPSSGMLLPVRECGRNEVYLPRFQVGWLAEVLFTSRVHNPGVRLYDVKPAGDQGIDLIAYVPTHELRQDLERSLGLTVHPSSRPARGAALLPTLFFFEVKANQAHLSDAQKDFETFAKSRLKKVLSSTSQTERAQEARRGARRALSLLATPTECNVSAYVIRIEFPEPHESGPIVMKTYPWQVRGAKANRTVEGTVTLAQTTDVFEIDGWRGPLRREYATSKVIGDLGEERTRAYLSALGFTDIRSMQNNIGNGIDLLAYHPVTNRWCFFEIKSHWSDKAGLARLRGEQRCEWEYTRKKTLEVILGAGNFSHSRVDLYTQLLAGIVYAELGGNEPSKRYSIEKHFIIDVFLPSAGTRGRPRLTIRKWDKDADLAPAHTHAQVEEHREHQREERLLLTHADRFDAPTPNDPFGTCPKNPYDPVMDIWSPPSPPDAARIQALHDTDPAQWAREQLAARERLIEEARQHREARKGVKEVE